MTKKEITIVALAVVIIFGVGAFAGYKIGSKAKSNPLAQNGNDTYQAGWDAAKKKLAESQPALPGMAEVKVLSGKVEKVDGNNITLKVSNALDPLADPNLDTRIVETDSNTKFIQQTPKDPAQLQKEMADFNKQMQAQAPTSASSASAVVPAKPLTPPQPFDTKEISLADIKTDQVIMVTSGDNIKDAKQFKATEITIQFIPAAPTTGAPTSALPAPPAVGGATSPTAVLPPPPVAPTPINNAKLPPPPALPKN